MLVSRSCYSIFILTADTTEAVAIWLDRILFHLVLQKCQQYVWAQLHFDALHNGEESE